MSKYKKSILLSLLLLIAFTGLSIRIGSTTIESFDQVIIEWTQPYISDRLTTVMIIFTTIGSYKVEYLILLVTGFFYWVRRRNLDYPLMLVIALLGVRLLNQLLKLYFVRPRPEGYHLVSAGGYSFPSGHAMISMGFYGFVAYLLFREGKKKSNQAFFIPVLIGILILGIGYSRIYLGVHYPSDVIGGFLMGGLWLTCCIVFLNIIKIEK